MRLIVFPVGATEVDIGVGSIGERAINDTRQDDRGDSAARDEILAVRALSCANARCYNSKMGMKKITRCLAAWIACFAVLFAALAPSVSHAVSAARGAAWAEICGVSGAKLVNMADDQGSADPVKQSGHLEHCPFCATHAASFALPPGAGLLLALIETQTTHPPLFFQSPRPLSVWAAPQSRAPPAQA